MKNILCILGFHKYKKWKKINDRVMCCKLERSCKRCNNIETYIGMTETCIITDEESPYIMKH